MVLCYKRQYFLFFAVVFVFKGPFSPSIFEVNIKRMFLYKFIWVQSNLDYPDLDCPDFSIIRTFSLVPCFYEFFFLLISFDLKSFQR